MSLKVGEEISFKGQPAIVVGNEYGVPVVEMLPDINEAVQEAMGQTALMPAPEQQSVNTET